MKIMLIAMETRSENYLEITQTLRAINKHTANKAGCLRSDVYCKLEDKNSLLFLGEWKTSEALNQYFASHQFSVLLGTKALLRESVNIRIFTVSHSEGMDAVHSLRESKSKQTPLDKDS